MKTAHFAAKRIIQCMVYLLFMVSLLSLWGADRAEETDYFFPREEYEHYMRLIKEIDSSAHARLAACKKELGVPCIEKASDTDKDSWIDPGTSETNGHPIIILKSMADLPEQDQINLLKEQLDVYKSRAQIRPISVAERQKILQIIDSLDPVLYKAIVSIDPTGEKHIQREYTAGFAALASVEDGLPVIYIDQDSLERYPLSYLRASIAHELGHYLSEEHFWPKETPTHNYLFKNRAKGQAAKGKIVAGQLPAKETFYLARKRVEEYEADRSAILDFDIDVDVAIANLKALQAHVESLQRTYPKTFSSRHPLWADRIEHIESLRKEVELKKAHGRKRPSIDWQQIAQRYLTEFKEGY